MVHEEWEMVDDIYALTIACGLLLTLHVERAIWHEHALTSLFLMNTLIYDKSRLDEDVRSITTLYPKRSTGPISNSSAGIKTPCG